MSWQAFVNSLPPPYQTTPGERVRLLGCYGSATKGTTNEVRLVPQKNQIDGFSLFFGSKKACLQFMADRGLDCVNLADWGVKQLPEAHLFQDGGRA